jgi:NAD(P)-dependent dehydrogenase (short-subunit alcohol dehydrogenase family)
MGVLDNRVALLLGGGGGIGVATAIAYAREGARVAVADIDKELADAAAEAVAASGGEAWASQVDALADGQADALVGEVVAKFGRLDVMHNLTSTTVLAPSVELSLDDFERVFRVTVLGQFAGARAAARHMIAAGTKGSIINMSSIGGHGGLPERAPYTASAAAIVNLTRTLAVEWAPHGIRVNAIAPAWVMTDALARYDREFPGVLDFHAIEQRIPLGRLGTPEEVAGVAVFLASDAAAFVTGTTIHADGGVLAYIGPARQSTAGATNSTKGEHEDLRT